MQRPNKLAYSHLTLADDSEVESKHILIFGSNSFKYAVPIENVVEVLDTWQTSEYPEPQPNHIGLVHVRGRILPVVIPNFIGSKSKKKENSEDKRLLILDSGDSGSFGVEVEYLKKYNKATDLQSMKVININDEPVTYVEIEDFFK